MSNKQQKFLFLEEVPKITSWQKVRFDQLAENIVVHVDVPSESGYEKFVGGDHLDSGSLKISRWGSTSDVEAQKLLFKKGHILFGKRNAYLRKAAYADFDGVCSAHMLVLQPKTEYMIKELFPHFMHTDQFWERANMISEGSMSPTIKWKILAEQEFLIPPKDEQRRIADILWKLENTSEKWAIVRNKLQLALDKTLAEVFSNSEWSYSCLKAHVKESAYGPRFSNSLYSDLGSMACLRTTDLLEDGTIIYSTIPKAALDPIEYQNHVLKTGDFLITRSGTCGIGCVFVEQGIPTIPGAFLIRLRLNPTLDPYFLKEFINSSVGKTQINSLAQGGVQKNINGSLLLNEVIPTPSVDKQTDVVKLIRNFREPLLKVNEQLIKLMKLKTQLIANLLI